MSINISSLSAIVTVVLLYSGGATADTPTQQSISGDSGSAAQVADTAGDATDRKKKRKKKAKKICTREKVTGSHMRQRVCRTQAEIDARKEADQRMLNDVLPTGGGSPSAGR